MQHFPVGIHTLPEAIVLVYRELAARRSVLEYRGLERQIFTVWKGIERRALEHEEPAVDPARAGLWLLEEMADEGTVEEQLAEARGRAYGSDSYLLALF